MSEEGRYTAITADNVVDLMRYVNKRSDDGWRLLQVFEVATVPSAKPSLYAVMEKS